MYFYKVVPIFRFFDIAKVRAFYVDYLGFTVDFEHCFDADAPLYFPVTRGGCTLHLSEHHGDATPGAHIRVAVSDLDAVHSDLTAKRYAYLRPGIRLQPWGTRKMTVTDPFCNRLTFVADTPGKSP